MRTGKNDPPQCEVRNLVRTSDRDLGKVHGVANRRDVSNTEVTKGTRYIICECISGIIGSGGFLYLVRLFSSFHELVEFDLIFIAIACDSVPNETRSLTTFTRSV